MFGTWDKGVITGYFNVDLTQSVVIKASIMETHVGAKTVDSQVHRLFKICYYFH